MQCNNFGSENSCCIFGQDFRPYFPWKCFGKVNAKLQTGLLFVQPWLIFSFPDTTFSKWQGLFCFSLVQNIKMHLSKIDLFRESHMKKRCLDQVRVRLANCPAVFLSYFHCGFVMTNGQFHAKKTRFEVTTSKTSFLGPNLLVRPHVVH